MFDMWALFVNAINADEFARENALSHGSAKRIVPSQMLEIVVVFGIDVFIIWLLSTTVDGSVLIEKTCKLFVNAVIVFPASIAITGSLCS